ncbi:hypothetical protein MUDAN_BIHEEGNE_02263 [Lactiplantibacillus mudanjiangensis]|nr:hypothetical protein MUDAN_BIHEEGNE_02263 [Lactiplantibacillus mudanjiangensis]
MEALAIIGVFWIGVVCIKANNVGWAATIEKLSELFE